MVGVGCPLEKQNKKAMVPTLTASDEFGRLLMVTLGTSGEWNITHNIYSLVDN